MAFGKKPSPPKPAAASIMSEQNLQALEALELPKRPQAAPQTIAQRIMPEELFDPATKGGRLMAAMGLSPDDESSVVKTDAALGEKMEDDRQRMLAFISQLNGNLPDGVNVAPYLMIPEECWLGPCRDFLLCYLQMTPYGGWNMLPLPRDHQSSDGLNIRMHPGQQPKSLVTNVEALIMSMAREVEAASDTLRKQMETRGKPDRDAMAGIADAARNKVRAMGWMITARVLGVNTLRRPRELFYNENHDGMLGTA
ncbi:MAG: hypothetical protein QM773_12400 [Hyphomonadaceae bacterium]